MKSLESLELHFSQRKAKLDEQVAQHEDLVQKSASEVDKAKAEFEFRSAQLAGIRDTIKELEMAERAYYKAIGENEAPPVIQG